MYKESVSKEGGKKKIGGEHDLVLLLLLLSPSTLGTQTRNQCADILAFQLSSLYTLQSVNSTVPQLSHVCKQINGTLDDLPLLTVAHFTLDNKTTRIKASSKKT